MLLLNVHSQMMFGTDSFSITLLFYFAGAFMMCEMKSTSCRACGRYYKDTWCLWGILLNKAVA